MSIHVIPVVFHVESDNENFTREAAALQVRNMLNLFGFNRAFGFWLPNDRGVNQVPLADDSFHLEWAPGPVPEDMGGGVVYRGE